MGNKNSRSRQPPTQQTRLAQGPTGEVLVGIPIAPAYVSQPLPNVGPYMQVGEVEVVADFSDSDHTTTTAEYQGNAQEVTHLSYHANHLQRIESLERYPSLVRLTVSWNDLRTLRGIDAVPNLKWVDAAGNYIETLEGMAHTPALEWLNLMQNDVTHVGYLSGFAPNLRWLCLHHNSVSDVRGISKGLESLQFLDLSDNELQNAEGLENCRKLTELNIANNPLDKGGRAAVESVKALRELPYLRVLNITDTFQDPEEAEIVKHFGSSSIEVVITAERSAELHHNVYFRGNDVPRPVGADV